MHVISHSMLRSCSLSLRVSLSARVMLRYPLRSPLAQPTQMRFAHLPLANSCDRGALAGFCDRDLGCVRRRGRRGDAVVVNAPDGRSKAEEVERSGIMDMGSER